MISSEIGEKKAQDLLLFADKLGQMIKDIDNMGREGWQAIIDEPIAYEKIVLEGPDFLNAIKSIAMRLDRSALIKYTGDEKTTVNEIKAHFLRY